MDYWVTLFVQDMLVSFTSALFPSGCSRRRAFVGVCGLIVAIALFAFLVAVFEMVVTI